MRIGQAQQTSHVHGWVWVSKGEAVVRCSIGHAKRTIRCVAHSNVIHSNSQVVGAVNSYLLDQQICVTMLL
ncbi:unnamed protein product [Ectocarpus sp. 6 AP-2014]